MVRYEMNAHAPWKIGLTGGIGAGKSTVAALLHAQGATVLDADAISRASLQKGGACVADVVNAFGNAVLTAVGEIDRRALAQRVFSDEDARRTLNGIIHPYVLREMFSQYDAAAQAPTAAIVVFDIPLLIECGAYRQMDRNIVVIADDALRIARLRLRSGLTEAEARARIASQIPQSEQARYADELIDNSAGLDELSARVAEIYRSFTTEEYR